MDNSFTFSGSLGGCVGGLGLQHGCHRRQFGHFTARGKASHQCLQLLRKRHYQRNANEPVSELFAVYRDLSC